jgi:addiction module HigA family antidote
MIPENRTPTHPGEVLQAEFLVPLELTQVELAKRLEIPLQRVNEIVRGRRGVTAETAWLLSQFFGTSPEFWTNLQTAYDLARARPTKKIPRLKRRNASLKEQGTHRVSTAGGHR